MKKRNQSFPLIPIQRIAVNPEQPRRFFEPTELEELAGTIREHGVIQPIAVEECGDDYILHDGERRWRAAKLAGLTTIPAVVSPPLNGTGPRERLERALVANVQRSQMSPVEEGLAYQRLITEFGYSIDGVAKKIGKHYTHVHHRVRLVTMLEPEIQQFMLERKLPSADEKILKALLTVPAGEERIALARAMAEKNMTVKGIVYACARYKLARGAAKLRRRTGSPAIAMVQKELPEWDALYQLGRVPPWPLLNNAVMATCDTCPVRHTANEITCGDCALVIGLKRMMEAVHGDK